MDWQMPPPTKFPRETRGKGERKKEEEEDGQTRVALGKEKDTSLSLPPRKREGKVDLGAARKMVMGRGGKGTVLHDTKAEGELPLLK